MKVKVLLFASLREKIGTNAEVVEVPDSASTVAGTPKARAASAIDGSRAEPSVERR